MRFLPIMTRGVVAVKDVTWNTMVVGMNGLSKRFSAVAQNIANVNTPGYARSEVTFEDELRETLAEYDRKKMDLVTNHEAHISNGPRGVSFVIPKKHRVIGELVRWDGNGVELDIEMSKLAQTRMTYTALAKLMSKRVGSYRLAIGGR